MSNHRRTLELIAITTVLCDAVHWGGIEKIFHGVSFQKEPQTDPKGRISESLMILSCHLPERPMLMFCRLHCCG